MAENIYAFELNDLSGQPVSLADYKNQVLLVVNTASKCGFTPQLKGLEELHQKYQQQGFSVLGFPSNDFGNQEPLDGDGIGEFCERNYGVSFPMFEKVVVKGKEAVPLYQWLSQKKLNGRLSSKPKWNFHKYLIDRQGLPHDFFYSTTSPTARRLERKLESLLKE